MRSNTELVKNMLKNTEMGDLTAMGADIADDFVFSGATPEPMNKTQFIALMRLLTSAISEWRFNITDISEEGNIVRVVNHITGKNTGTVNFPSLGIVAVPATGLGIALPAEPLEVVVRDGKIAAFRVKSVPGGGVTGILTQLGIKVPATAGMR